MKTFTIAEIRGWGPCYDPKRHLQEDWSGTVLDIAKMTSVPIQDRLWVVMRSELLSDKLMRLYAVWCARQVQHLMTDPRSLAALDVAERFANGEATEQERAAAWAAAWDAAGDAARAAARDAAWDAAWAAARAAAWDAAGAAAWAAAWDAARAAAWAAARDAAWDAAWAAARDAAWDAQSKKLIEMIEAGIESGDVK